MNSLKSILPAPSRASPETVNIERAKKFSLSRPFDVTSRAAPDYGNRNGWIPRSPEDFGNGGAFPEIHVPQYPWGLGSKKATSNAIPLQVDARGKIRYDAVLGQSQNKGKTIYHRYEDVLPSEITNEDDPDLQRPNEEEIKRITEATRSALEKLSNSKTAAAFSIRSVEKPAPKHYIRFTPSQGAVTFNSGARQRIIRMAEVQKDPMKPIGFKINRHIPRSAPSPPAPVMHSPPRRVSTKDQHAWRIPPCISKWKNTKGSTIPLDMRLAADGRGLQQVHINENFAKVQEALYVAERKAREGVESRAQIQKKLAQKQREKHEAHLRHLAQKSREDRAGITSTASAILVDEGARERDVLRRERHKERQRARNVNRAAPNKCSKLDKQRERDVSEQIALGLPNTNFNTGEVQLDQRLFNRSKGLDSGFGESDEYNCYDRPWKADQHLANYNAIYKRGRHEQRPAHEGNLEVRKASRCVPRKQFSKPSHSVRPDGPVAFEKFEDDKQDIFGLDKFLEDAKKASKRRAVESDHETEKNKRRKN